MKSILACLVLALMPLVSEADPTTIEAAAYGVDPAAPDNTAALRSAVAACHKAGSDVRLILPEGTLRFDATSLESPKRVVQFKGIKGLEIIGNDTTVLLTGNPTYVTNFYFEDCADTVVKGIVFDCEYPMCAQGIIKRFDADGLIEIEIDPKYPLIEGLPIESIIDGDPQTGLMLANIDLYKVAIVSTETPEPNLLVVNFKLHMDANDPNRKREMQEIETVLPGHSVVLRQFSYGGYTLEYDKCDGITVEDVTIYAVAGMGVKSALSSDHILRRLTIAPRKDSGVLISAVKDGVHFTHAIGKVIVEDCYFDAIGDDAINVYSKYRNVSKITDNSSIEMIFDRNRGWQGPTPLSGETLNFWEKDSMQPIGSAQVVNANWNPNTKKFRVRFSGKLPEGLKPGDWINSSRYVPSFEIRDSYFRGMLGRAIVISTGNVVVENCDIIGTCYTGMLLTSGARHERQGPSPRNVRIANNRFSNTGGAAIYGYVFVPDPGTDAMNNITITGNTITEDPRMAKMRLKARRPDWMHWYAGICLTSTSDLTVSDNSFSGYEIPVFLENIKNLTLTDNNSDTPSLAVLNRTVGDVTVSDNENLTVESDEKDYHWDLGYIGIMR